MLFNKNLHSIVYPSWAKFSYKWHDLDMLLRSPLSSRYLAHRDDWFQLGYSRITDNFQLIEGPAGNGIIVKKRGKTADASQIERWLPGVLLTSEAYFRLPPGISAVSDYDYQVSYLTPKPNDMIRLGIGKQKVDPMPYFSIEPFRGLDESACLCVTGRGSGPIESSVALTRLLLSFGITAEQFDWSSDPNIRQYEGVNRFCEKWGLKSTWYFLDSGGYDLGVLFAIAIYMGGHLRHKIGPRIKSIHLVTSIPNYPEICPTWSMQRLR